MSMSELTEAFADAHNLIRSVQNAAFNGPDDDHSDDEPELARSCSQRLCARLQMMKGVPTAVGSGKRDLRRVAHSLVHSVRLEASSWPAACALLNSTVSFTGDLGTESGLWRFRTLVPELHGDWVKTSAPADEAAAGFVLHAQVYILYARCCTVSNIIISLSTYYTLNHFKMQTLYHILIHYTTLLNKLFLWGPGEKNVAKQTLSLGSQRKIVWQYYTS